MWAVIGVVALGVAWWTREESAPPPPSVPVLPPRTTAEKWGRELTDKALTIIHTNDDRPVRELSIPKRQIHCCVVKPESWDEVAEEFRSFCLKEDTSESDPAIRQVAKWAESVGEMIQTMNRLNETRRTLQEEGEFCHAARCLDDIRKVVDDFTNVLRKQLDSTQHSEVEVYKKYSKLLKKLSHTKYWSALLTFLSSGSSMSETSPQILVQSSRRERDDDKSEEEHLKSLVKNKKTSGMIATGVIEATGQHTMKKREFFGSDIVCFSTGFAYRVEAPDSPRANAFREAIAFATKEINQDAMARTKARRTWPNRQGQATWSEVSATPAPVRRVVKRDSILQEVDHFLDKVE